MNSGMFATGIRMVLIGLFVSSQRLIPQSFPHDVLTNILSQESSRYSLLTYTQRYIDEANERVQYKGTIFLQIESFKLDGCILKIDVVVQDRYVGSEEHKLRLGTEVVHENLGQKMDTYRYAYYLDLKSLDDAHISPIAARPSQLPSNTMFVCEEETSCDVQWLKVVVKKPSILETRALNGLLDFNRAVDQITIPVTSQEVAQQSARSMQNLATACR